MNRKWLTPGLVGVTVAAIVGGVAVWSAQGRRSSSVPDSAFTASLSDQVTRQLTSRGFTVEALAQPGSNDGGEKAAEAVAADFRFLGIDQVQSVTLAKVGSKERDYESAPTWVVYFQDVEVPNLGGIADHEEGQNSNPEGGETAPMIVLIDPSSFDLEYAIQ